MADVGVSEQSTGFVMYLVFGLVILFVIIGVIIILQGVQSPTQCEGFIDCLTGYIGDIFGLL